MKLHPDIKRWRKRIKGLGQCRVDQRGWSISVFFDNRWFTDISLTLPTNFTDDRLRHLRFEYERFTLYSLNTENR